jgi:hypothetical protein
MNEIIIDLYRREDEESWEESYSLS